MPTPKLKIGCGLYRARKNRHRPRPAKVTTAAKPLALHAVKTGGAL